VSNTPQPAKYKAGDTKGRLTVVRPLKRDVYHPVTGHHQAKPIWWYECRCSCGNTVVCSQSLLNDGRKTPKCPECNKDSKSRKLSARYRKAAKPAPDFATMRLR